MGMLTARCQAYIDRPLEAVYAFVVDDFFDNYPRWSPEVVDLIALTGPRLELGAMARQVRAEQGRRFSTTFEVTALEPDARIVFESIGSPAFRTEYEFDRSPGGGAQLAFAFTLKRMEMHMRPFEKLIAQAIDDGCRRTVVNIKGLMERQ